VLVDGSASGVDLLLVGDLPEKKVQSAIHAIESAEGRELAYSILTYDEFYYRLSVHDRFINDILNNKHAVLTDVDEILSK